ncbi:uncharacterized protein N7459_005422 [Penicillium hispanicum]|uniref:uncharacterized protein n=1 Tax=Penicillium hispanicum TaxID=1080232 RepID=UPI0025422E7F|nr:uncharacterized protein N7459_005422 [Penicillium hispanicum]KAJ5585622.1 hypothetical protein N7459_005422 [Penicillium hispanicum]
MVICQRTYSLLFLHPGGGPPALAADESVPFPSSPGWGEYLPDARTQRKVVLAQAERRQRPDVHPPAFPGRTDDATLAYIGLGASYSERPEDCADPTSPGIGSVMASTPVSAPLLQAPPRL